MSIFNPPLLHGPEGRAKQLAYCHGHLPLLARSPIFSARRLLESNFHGLKTVSTSRYFLANTDVETLHCQHSTADAWGQTRI